MINVLQRETNTITVANFWENYLLDKYNFTPAYQRLSVWSEEKQSFFIDSILRNFPIPPIFLHQHIDDATGKTRYDIIDGKQRLESIVKFIKGEIPVSVELDDGNGVAEPLAGAYFKEFERDELQEYKKRFWRYVIPIEYIDTSSRDLIDKVFDRLNRNGEPLQGQELRHAQYHSSNLLKTVRLLAEIPFWKQRLKVTEVSRMEDQEFISEIIFVLLEGVPLEADQRILDQLYGKYTSQPVDWSTRTHDFEAVTDIMNKFDLEYDRLKIGGMSHLYGIWCLAHYCYLNKISPDQIKTTLSGLFEHLRGSDDHDDTVELYRKSMSFNTRSRAQRVRRLNALLKYTGLTA